jgi:septum formation protein
MLLLASASPRRAVLLKAAGIPFDVLASRVDEVVLPGEEPTNHVRRLALAKAQAVAALRPGALVLGADTVVVVDGVIFGKPRDQEEASGMLRALSARAHDVYTGVALVAKATAPRVDVAWTRVWFSSLSDADIEWYVQSGEPMDKAGAYAIQGLGSRFVDRLDGSYSNVVGLPVSLVWRLVKEMSETVWQVTQ